MKFSQRLGSMALVALVPLAVQAQGNFTRYDFSKQSFPMIDEEGLPVNSHMFGVFQRVSANGKYAVGTDEELAFRSYLWQESDPTNLEIYGDYKLEVALYDVTNDGTLVGGIRDNSGMMYPAYKPQGAKWQMLTRGMENLNREMATYGNVSQALRATTPDGQYMAGSFYMNTGKVSDSGVEISHLLPVVWKDGKLLKVYDDLGIETFMVWDISDDGQTIVGMNTAGIGGQNPSFIRDGKLYQLFDCGPERTEQTGPEVYGNIEGGICHNIDNMGNIYGYYYEAVGDYQTSETYFVVPAGCDYAIFLDKDYNNKFPAEYCTPVQYICGGNGARYINEDAELPYLLDCSDDGRVFVGGGVYNLGFGVTNVPQVTIFDEAKQPSRIDVVAEAAQAQGIIVSPRSVKVKGVYESATVYDAKGSLVVRGGQGQPLVLPEGRGVYMVSVKYADGMKTYRMAR